MNPWAIKWYRLPKRARMAINGTIWLIVVALVLSVCSVAYATPSVRYMPAQQRPAVIYHHHDHIDPAPYIFAGVVVGLVIYSITSRKCDHGVVCTRF